VTKRALEAKEDPAWSGANVPLDSRCIFTTSKLAPGLSSA